MHRLSKILLASFHILGQNLVLGYPYFLFFMVVLLVMPMEGLVTVDFSGAQGLSFYVFIAALVLLAFAFLAALFQMIYTASEDYLQQLEVSPEEMAEQMAKEDPNEILFAPFKLLKEMMPGIGNHFVQFTIGGVINLVVLGLLAFAVIYVSSEMLPTVKTVFVNLQQLAQEESPDLFGFFEALGLDEREALTAFTVNMTYASIVYGLFFLVTIFWPSLVVSRNISAVQAYQQSIKLFISDPLTILTGGLLYFVLNLSVGLLLSTNVVLLVLRPFITVFVDIYFLTATMLYVLMIAQKGNDEELLDVEEGKKLNVTG